MTQNLEFYNFNGDKINPLVTEVPLEVIFGTLHPHAMHLRMVCEQDGRRARTHKTLTMSEVNGSTRKIVKQKGSGGARHGSRKAPIFRHGGISHGRLPGGRVKRLPKKVMTLGLLSAISYKLAQGKMIIIDNLITHSNKTQNFVQSINWIRDIARENNSNAALSSKISALPRILFVDELFESNFKMASSNAKHVDIIPFAGLNVNSILKSDCLVVSSAALAKMLQRFYWDEYIPTNEAA